MPIAKAIDQQTLELMAECLAAGATMGELALDFELTRSQVSGYMSRNRHLFPVKDKVRQLSRKSAGGSAKKMLAGEVSESQTPIRLDGLVTLKGAGAQLDPRWKVAERGAKLFVYRGMEPEPRYVFRKAGQGSGWVGHGVLATTKTQVYGWVNSRQP